MRPLLAALLLAVPALAFAQSALKPVDDPGWWFNTPPETLCDKAAKDAALQNIIDADNKRIKQTNLVKEELKVWKCAKDDATAAAWRDRCRGQKNCGESKKCPALRKALPPPVDFFADVDKFEATIGREYQACVDLRTRQEAAARAAYAKADPPVAPDPKWAGKSCAELKKTRDAVAGVSATCVLTPAMCLLDAAEVASLEATMKKLGCGL